MNFGLYFFQFYHGRREQESDESLSCYKEHSHLLDNNGGDIPCLIVRSGGIIPGREEDPWQGVPLHSVLMRTIHFIARGDILHGT
jgi:hypothetical protein